MPSSSSHRHESDDELLSAYVDNELTAAERATVEERLRTDERARQLVAELRTASDAVRSLPRVSLGRDLAASVFAEIDAEDAVESATVLAMPQVEQERRGARGRGLMWAGLAVAAALLLMVLREADEPVRDRGERQVAQAPSEKRLEGPASGTGSAIETKSGDEGGAGVAMSRSGGLQSSGAAPGIERQRSAVERREADRTAQSERAATATAESAQAPSTAAAPSAADGALSEGEESTVPDPAAEAAPDGEPETIDVAIADEGDVAAFEQLLASRGIAIVDEQLPARLLGELRGRDADAATALENLAAVTADGEVDAYLVETTPDELRALIDGVRTTVGKLKAGELADQTPTSESAANETPPSADRRGFGGGLGGDREPAPFRAWRLSQVDESGDARDEAQAFGGAAPAASEPAADRFASGRGGSQAGSSTELVRAVFLLRREVMPAAAPAAAGPQP